MAVYSPTIHEGVTDQYEWEIGFPYAQAADVHVFIDDVERAFGSGAGEWLFSDSGTQIIFQDGDEPQTGETLKIARDTSVAAAIVTFIAGGGITPLNMNATVNQLLYAIDELSAPPVDTGELAATLLEEDGDQTFGHTFGAIPTRVTANLTCTSTDLGYAVGDVVDALGGGGIPVKIYWTATEIAFRAYIGQTVRIFAKNSAAFQFIDLTKWTIRLRAWK